MVRRLILFLLCLPLIVMTSSAKLGQMPLRRQMLVVTAEPVPSLAAIRRSLRRASLRIWADGGSPRVMLTLAAGPPCRRRPPASG